MSMSHSSSLSPLVPSHPALEDALRNAVRRVYESGALENLTVKRIRKAAEEILDLDEDYFKNDDVWKEKSKSIIQSEVEAHAEPSSSQISPPKKPSPKLSRKKANLKTDGETRGPSAKRRRKKGADSDSLSDNDLEKKRENPATEIIDAKAVSPAPMADATEDIETGEPPSKVVKASGKAGADDSESEMSELLDEAPKPRRKRKSSEVEKGSSKKKPKTPKGPKAEQPTDPNTEEIKRLQSWLVKCGIRKMWYKELQPYATPNAKIRHLKDMLAEAGMTGRYSAEKASQIREERELKADLDAVQAGNKQWGMEEPEEDDNIRPKRRLAKGLKELDFLNEDDGEESD